MEDKLRRLLTRNKRSWGSDGLVGALRTLVRGEESHLIIEDAIASLRREGKLREMAVEERWHAEDLLVEAREMLKQTEEDLVLTRGRLETTHRQLVEAVNGRGG